MALGIIFDYKLDTYPKTQKYFCAIVHEMRNVNFRPNKINNDMENLISEWYLVLFSIFANGTFKCHPFELWQIRSHYIASLSSHARNYLIVNYIQMKSPQIEKQMKQELTLLCSALQNGEILHCIHFVSSAIARTEINVSLDML